MSSPVIFRTKGYLLDLKKKLAMLEEGYEILSKKRDELMARLMKYIKDLKEMRQKVITEINKIYSMFLYVTSALSLDEINMDLANIRGTLAISIVPISIMGVMAPRIKILRKPKIEQLVNDKLYLLAFELSKYLTDFFKLVELEALIESIIFDLQRTNRIVNSLEKIVIPKTKELIKQIESMIEEEMLEEFTRTKMIRDIVLKRRGG